MYNHLHGRKMKKKKTKHMKENKENCLLKQKLKKENIKREMYVPPVSDFAIIFLVNFP